MPATTRRSISHVGTISVVAIIVIIAAGGADLANTMTQSSSIVGNNTMIPYTGSTSTTSIGSTSVVTINTTTILTTINTSTPTITSVSSQSAGALLIRLDLNGSRITSGATIEFSVSDYNPSLNELNLSKGDNWALNGLATGGCPSLYLPFGIAVFQGTYTSANVSQAVPLPIFPVVACPMIVMYITGYLFQPMSDNATILPNAAVDPMATGISVSGTYNTGNQLNQFTPFAPGTYTVVAGDEWGNLAFAYFVVN